VPYYFRIVSTVCQCCDFAGWCRNHLGQIDGREMVVAPMRNLHDETAINVV
jgi:hypothetical protein